MDTDISEINEIDNFRSTTEKKQAGRPTKYSEKMALRVAMLVGEGNSLRAISRMDGYPSLSTLMRWQIEYPSLREAIAWMKWLHAMDLGQQAIEAIDAVDINAEDAPMALKKAQAKARALIDAAKLTDLKSSPFGGKDHVQAEEDQAAD
ncbi:hypothetical protein HVV71_06535 [Escherichia coli]|nr:hypothetical protein [Escherichia coli]HDQ6705667.1 hypothetical protein [Escherichia coli Ou:H26]EEC8206500.1 hypothetical protein [Escherichia coli]EEC8525963.1 hypothetical protein [Escherichia coli]EEC8855585.1 hypothetical protein [Escherichia coli]